MTDFEHILPLWRELESAGAEYVLATVVAVEGSSYRKPGARMLLAQDGRRAGTVSGGCLEAEVAKKAWWRTENGPVVERYSTLDDDGDLPYGSGCGGVVYILLERRGTASAHLQQLYAAFESRTSLAIAAVLSGPQIGTRAFAGITVQKSQHTELQQLATTALDERASQDTFIMLDGTRTRVWVDYRPARPGLWIFGAGDDAKPLLQMARQLGWFVAIADGRTHLATRARFSAADDIRQLRMEDLPADAAAQMDVRRADAAVLMTHSFEQDARVLASLLARGTPPAYMGVLGPQRRTREVLVEAARLLQMKPSAERIEQWMELLHGPTGLDLGAETPAAVALSILSEIQQVLHAGSARPLREVRATPQIFSR